MNHVWLYTCRCSRALSFAEAMRRPGTEPDCETVLIGSLCSPARAATRVIQFPRSAFAARGLLAAKVRRPGIEPDANPRWRSDFRGSIPLAIALLTVVRRSNAPAGN